MELREPIFFIIPLAQLLNVFVYLALAVLATAYLRARKLYREQLHLGPKVYPIKLALMVCIFAGGEAIIISTSLSRAKECGNLATTIMAPELLGLFPFGLGMFLARFPPLLVAIVAVSRLELIALRDEEDKNRFRSAGQTGELT